MGLFKRKKAASGQIPLLAADDPRIRALFDLMTMEKVFNVPLNVRTRDIAVEEAILVTDSGKQYLRAYTRDPNSHDSGEEIIWGGAEGYKAVELAGSMDGIDGIVIDDEHIIPMSLVLMMHLAPPPIPGFQPNREVTQERVRIAMLRENPPG